VATRLSSPAQPKKLTRYERPKFHSKSSLESLPPWLRDPLASAVALVTGHEELGKSESALDWDALARFPGTLVIYMGVTTAPAWTKALIDAGKPSDTPAAIVRRCSLPDQQTILCRLDEVSDHVRQNKIRPPAIVILGPVAELSKTMDWARDRPLFGQSVLVTRPVEQAEALAAPLRELGADVVLQPAIKIGPPESWDDVDQAIEKLGDFDLVVFCSHNGVKYFIDRLLHSGVDARRFGTAKIATVGSKTAQALQKYGLVADIVPNDFRAESLASELDTKVSGKRVLVIRASRGSDLIGRALTDSGADVTELVAYSHCDVDRADRAIIERAANGQIDWVTAMSSASATSLVNLFGDSLDKMKIASLSPVTSKTLADRGYKVSAEADPYTIESLIKVIVEAKRPEKRG